MPPRKPLPIETAEATSFAEISPSSSGQRIAGGQRDDDPAMAAAEPRIDERDLPRRARPPPGATMPACASERDQFSTIVTPDHGENAERRRGDARERII